MNAPKFVLIGRKALEDNLDAVKLALEPITLGVSFVACEKDAQAAKRITEAVAGFPDPVVIVADFNFDCAVIDDEGTVEPVILREEKPEERPLITLIG